VLPLNGSVPTLAGNPVVVVVVVPPEAADDAPLPPEVEDVVPLEELVGVEPDEEVPVEEDAGDEEPEFEGSEHPIHTNNIVIINIATTVNLFFIENSSFKYVITQYRTCNYILA